MRPGKKYPWGTDRRFNPWVEQMKQRFGGRVQKLALDAGFTCPNRDGRSGRGGCTFCLNEAFNPSYCQPSKSIQQQLTEGMDFHRKRYQGAVAYLAYFQAYSNTYAEESRLRDLYNQALSHPGISGLVIGTRPDCLPDESLSLLRELAESTYVHIELGLESLYDSTLLRIMRGHDSQSSRDAIRRCAQAGLKPGVHMIFGLPGENPEMMLAQAGWLSEMEIASVKFHQLQVIRGTAMEAEYLQTPDDFHEFRLDEYIEFVIDFLERLRPDIMIERFAGEVPPRFRVQEGWGNIRYERVIQLIENRLEKRNTWQGRLYSD
jgi:uncharacterized protein